MPLSILNVSMIINVLIVLQQLVSPPCPIPNNAFNKNVQTNGPLAKKIQNAFPPFKIVKRNAEPKPHAGHSAFLAKVVKLLSMLQNVPKQTIAFDLHR